MKTDAKTVLFVLVLGGVAFAAKAGLVTNITAYCRANNAATATLVRGEHYHLTNWHVEHAFDGDVTTDDGRMLLKTLPTEENPVIVGYDISESFCPGEKFVVNGFRYYRAPNVINRSITKIYLECSDDGTNGWVRLGGASSPVTILAAVDHYTLTIPMKARRPSRHYRFLIAKNNNYDADARISTRELELLGEVLKPEELVWNGGASGTWDAASAVWTNAQGAATAWQGRGAAVIPSGAVTLSGTAEVSEVRLGSIGQTLAGGTLGFRRPAILSGRHGAVVSSAIADGDELTDTLEGAAAGTRVFDGFLKRDDSYTEERDRTYYPHSLPTCIWENRQVSEIVGIVGTGTQTYKRNGSTPLMEAYPLHVYPNDSGLRFQLHAKWATSDLFFAEGFNLTQSNACVNAQALFSKYCWNNSAELFQKWDCQWEAAKLNTGSVWDEDHDETYHNGARGPFLAVSELTPALTVRCAGGESAVAAEYLLPRSETNDYTGAAVTFLRNARLEALVGFKGATLVNGSKLLAASPYNVKRTADAVNVQFKSPYSDAYCCVKVEFTQSGDDIDARVVYARYHRNLPADYDCDIPAATMGGAMVRDATHETGLCYGIKNIAVDYLERMTVSGSFPATRDVSIVAGGLTLGAPSLSLGQNFAGAGLLAFASAGESQAVTFAGACACERGLELSGRTTLTLAATATLATNLAFTVKGGATLAIPADSAREVTSISFSGTSAVTVASGASLALETATLADDAVVNVTCADEQARSAVRIGTAATLSRAVLRHFRINGKTVSRQTSEGWLDPIGPGMIIFVR